MLGVTMPKRVGILTFHHTTNYGATLQTWALQKRLRELGIDSEIIDYRPAKARAAYRRALFFNRHFFQGVRKALAFADFRHHHLKLSPQTIFALDALQTAVPNYDTVICGSDEVWNTDSFRGYDPGFFLSFPAANHVHKCSYAASSGSTRGFGDSRAEIATAVRAFEAISVRDEATQALLRAECGVEAARVVDPTLLVSFDELIGGFPCSRSPFVLVYGSLAGAEQELVVARAAQMGCRIVSVGEFNRCADENIPHAGVPLWLSLMRDAEMVFTSFYHGAIFAWKFGRPLVVFRRADKARKVEGFVGDMALLATPFVDAGGGGIEAIQYSDSEETSVCLEAVRAKADRFLRSCLG
jgi:hypothetical protein